MARKMPKDSLSACVSCGRWGSDLIPGRKERHCDVSFETDPHWNQGHPTIDPDEIYLIGYWEAREPATGTPFSRAIAEHDLYKLGYVDGLGDDEIDLDAILRDYMQRDSK